MPILLSIFPLVFLSLSFSIVNFIIVSSFFFPFFLSFFFLRHRQWVMLYSDVHIHSWQSNIYDDCFFFLRFCCSMYNIIFHFRLNKCLLLTTINIWILNIGAVANQLNVLNANIYYIANRAIWFFCCMPIFIIFFYSCSFSQLHTKS